MSGTPINNSLEIYDLANLLYDEHLVQIRDMGAYVKAEQVKISSNSDQEEYIKKLFGGTLFPTRDIPLTTELLLLAFRNKVSFFPSGLGASDIPRLINRGTAALSGSELLLTIVPASVCESSVLGSFMKRSDIHDMSFFDYCVLQKGEPLYISRGNAKELSL